MDLGARLDPRDRAGPRPWRPVAVGALVEGSGLAIGAGAGVLTPLPAMGALLGYLGGGTAILSYWRRRRLGAANLVTLSRVVGTCWVIGLALQATEDRLSRTDRLDQAGLIAIIAVGAGCLVLDGVDGHLARARGESSAFGARFDMETDAALLLALSLAVAALGLAGWWVLAIGLMRYAYVAASWIGPRRIRVALRTPLPYHYSRKVVAVAQAIALLLALLLAVIGIAERYALLPSLILAAALAALCWSFGSDVAWQLRTGAR